MKAFFYGIIIALFAWPLLSSAKDSEKNQARGLAHSKQPTIPIFGFLSQTKSHFILRTDSHKILVEKMEFMKVNKISKNSEFRQAKYMVPPRAIVSKLEILGVQR